MRNLVEFAWDVSPPPRAQGSEGLRLAGEFQTLGLSV